MIGHEKEVVESSGTGPRSSRAGSLWCALAIGLLIVACAAFSFVVRGHSRSDRVEGRPIQPAGIAKSSPVLIGQAKEPAAIIGGLGVTVTRQGFQPARIIRPPGRFVLAVVNKTALESLSLSLESPLGLAVRTKDLPNEESHWADVYDLSPGRYTLRATNHPLWVCEIIVR